MTEPHPSIRQVAEHAVADGATHPEAKRAAMDAQQAREVDIDTVARHALYAVVYLIRDGGMRGSYADLDDATWTEVIGRIRAIISEEVTQADMDGYDAAYERLTQSGDADASLS